MIDPKAFLIGLDTDNYGNISPDLNLCVLKNTGYLVLRRHDICIKFITCNATHMLKRYIQE